MTRKKKDDSDTTKMESLVDQALVDLLTPGVEADKTKLSAINTAIKWIAVKHKINEDEWGGEFNANFEEGQGGDTGTDRDDG